MNSAPPVMSFQIFFLVPSLAPDTAPVSFSSASATTTIRNVTPIIHTIAVTSPRASEGWVLQCPCVGPIENMSPTRQWLPRTLLHRLAPSGSGPVSGG